MYCAISSNATFYKVLLLSVLRQNSGKQNSFLPSAFNALGCTNKGSNSKEVSYGIVLR